MGDVSRRELVVVITGASAGIGAGLARRLAPEGHRLVLAARRRDALEVVARDATALGAGDVIAVVTDVTHRDQVEHLRNAAVTAFGRIDVWVNNAGRGITKPVLELSDVDLDEMMAVNVKSALYGMQAAVAQFIVQGGGHLINVSSFLGRVPAATHRSAYNAAKAALNALTANLRVDLAVRHPDVHVSLVMPGIVATEFAANALYAPPDAKPRAWSAMAPQSVEEVAESIAALIAEPRAELYTNPASADVARRYFEDVAAFEAGARR
jgi:short-subunit dehydrogenase